VSRPAPFGPVELVRREGEQIGTGPCEVHACLADHLHRIDVQQCTRLARDRGDLLEREEHARFVVGRHHRDQTRVPGTHRRAQRIEVESAVAVDAEDGQRAQARPFEITGGVENGGMLDGGGDEMGSGLRRAHTAQGEVVGLGRSGGEHYAGRLHTEQFGDGAPRRVDRPAHRPAHVMVAPAFPKCSVSRGSIASSTCGSRRVVELLSR
jgi:hypothetical protein